MTRALALLCAGSLVACAPVLRTARMTWDEPLGDREREAQVQLEHTRCGRGWSLLFPGVGQLCQSRDGTAGAYAGLGVAELGLAAGVATKHDVTYPGVLDPLVAVQDLYLASVFDARIWEARAHAIPLTPQDSTQELLGAPFNVRALARPMVWGGLAGALAVDVGVSLLQGERFSFHGFGAPPRILGQTYAPLPGYAAAAGIYGALFEHVALAEEMTFRGGFQSVFAQRYGETKGWIIASLIFGLAHTFNALLLPPEQRVAYLAIDVPVITVLGAYLGLLYRQSGYSLVPSTAMHFWYDFLVSLGETLFNPQTSSLAGRILRLP